jgi:hypothetical protein
VTCKCITLLKWLTDYWLRTAAVWTYHEVWGFYSSEDSSQGLLSCTLCNVLEDTSISKDHAIGILPQHHMLSQPRRPSLEEHIVCCWTVRRMFYSFTSSYWGTKLPSNLISIIVFWLAKSLEVSVLIRKLTDHYLKSTNHLKLLDSLSILWIVYALWYWLFDDVQISGYLFICLYLWFQVMSDQWLSVRLAHTISWLWRVSLLMHYIAL